MTRRKPGGRQPRARAAKPETEAVALERPKGGGSWRRDRATGKLELVEATEQAIVGSSEPELPVDDIEIEDPDAVPGDEEDIPGDANDAAEQQEA